MSDNKLKDRNAVYALREAIVTSLRARWDGSHVGMEAWPPSDPRIERAHAKATVSDPRAFVHVIACVEGTDADALRALCAVAGLAPDGTDPTATLRERADLDSRIAAAAIGATARKHAANERLRAALAECLALLDAQATCYRCKCSLLVNPALPHCDPGCGVSDDDGALEVRADAHERAVQKRHDAAREAARLALAVDP